MARVYICDNCDKPVDVSNLFYEQIRYVPIGASKNKRTYLRSTHREVCVACLTSWIDEPARGRNARTAREKVRVAHAS